jgi:hypothetical protein
MHGCSRCDRTVDLIRLQPKVSNLPHMLVDKRD